MCGHTAWAQLNAAAQVDPQVSLPQFGALVVELPDVVERPRIVDEDVDRAELVHGTRHRSRDLFAVGHVAPNGE